METDTADADMDSVETGEQYHVLVVGGGVAGLTAGMFTARHGLETVVIDAGGSILRRNAHLENFPGFPAGVNARQFLDLLREQASNADCEHHSGTVTTVTTTDDGFLVETEDGASYQTEYVIAATKNSTSYLDGVEGVGVVTRGKTFVDTDDRGRTGVDGLYAAGRLAEKPHQAIVAAGHGAEVAITLLEDDDRPFYHDWVTPAGYFTDRGRDLPPGCEEIGPDDQQRRESESLSTMQDRFDSFHPDEQETHPSLEDDST